MAEHLQAELKVATAKRDNLLLKTKELFNLTKSLKSDSSKLPVFKARLEQIDSLYGKLDELCDRINTIKIAINPSDKAEYDSWNQFEELYFAIKAFASTQLAAPTPVISQTTTDLSLTSVNPKATRPRLPEIELPTWDSSFKNWPSFYDKFKSLIHENNAISDIDKFQYLLSAVTGSALINARGSLPITGQNYKIIWDSLIRKYEDKRVLGTDILERILNFPVLTKESGSNLNYFLEQFCHSVVALRAVKITDLSSFILLHLGLQRLPYSTRKLFEQNHLCSELPSFDQLMTFVENQAKVLEVSCLTKSFDLKTDKPSSSGKDYKAPQNKYPLKSSVRKAFVSSTDKSSQCCICKLSHAVQKCPRFLEMSPAQRKFRIRNLRFCFNCLKGTHMLNECPSKSVCHCGQRHHELLHILNTSDSSPEQLHTVNPIPQPLGCTSTQSGCHASINNNSGSVIHSSVLLGTAVVHIKDSLGRFQPVRILIDSGAQTSIITSSCVKRLGLDIRQCCISLSGISNNPVQVKGITTCIIKPRDSNFPQLNTDAVILSAITSDMPSIKVPNYVCQKYKHLVLADPNFDSPSPIDFLMAADLFPQIYDGQRLSSTPDMGPSALHSIFGWVITGKIEASSSSINVTSLLSTLDPPMDQLIKRFWESEEPPYTVPPNPEDLRCEELFSSLHYRDSNGRYVVPLPFKDNCPQLPPSASSYQLALSRLNSCERRLSRQPELRKAYSDFIEEYENLDHMDRVNSSPSCGKYFIPHHPVIKANSSSTQVRVVFDATAKLQNKRSLNEVLLTGPKLQLDICIVVTRFRFHLYALVADMRKMFRQILVRPKDRPYLHILWRPSPSDAIQEFQLKTVTYGTAPAPYLALRAVRQLVIDDGTDYPLASKSLLYDTYVDNIVSGTSSKNELLQLKNELISLLSRGGIELHQWNSNEPSVLGGTLEADQEFSLSFDLESSATVNILGLQWNAKTDCFVYSISPINLIFTKRSILSHIARIYDPLGWLCPTVFKAKLIIQHLWRLGLGWDDKVPLYIEEEWTAFANQFSDLSKIRIPRYLATNSTCECVLVGFCDASERGYAGVVYLRVINQHSSSINLIMAKTKVAPLKTISVPRLELCGAVLLTRLLKYILSSLNGALSVKHVYTFSDSTTVLTWLKTSPHLLKTFVGTRVAEILETLPPSSWHHISSSENPADCASRGLKPSELLNHSLWWHGPKWLTNPTDKWPISNSSSITTKTVPELRNSSTLNTLVLNEDSVPILCQFSSFIKTQRVTAWCFRFSKNSKLTPDLRNFGPLTYAELQDALLKLVRVVQEIHFYKDLRLLSSGKVCSAAVQALKPFIDPRGLLRVGGRLVNSTAPVSTIHPLLLPKSSHFTKILVDYYHVAYLHVGPRTLQSLICRKFWIISSRNVIRSRLAKCNVCHRASVSEVKAPLMGDLPQPRVRQGRPFINVAIDFGGPFIVKESKRRGSKTYKCYLCLFVCLATKAVHLEVVSDLTSDAFIACLNRFVSRRGLCHTIYSDCGTNFVGAARYLTDIYKFLSSANTEISDVLSKSSICWKFNVPSSPHMNGLAESGIRSVKHHFKRVVGEQILTFEELSTLFCKIEAILNSRPLCSLSSDPNELDVLTPGHFLTGSALTAVPEHDLEEVKINRLDRWELLQRTSQDFWRRWSRDYLHTLQQRSKWTTFTPNLKVGDLVLLLEDRLSTMQWIVGRIEEVHPGRDGVVRVAKVRTSRGTYLRPVVKLSPLPSQ